MMATSSYGAAATSLITARGAARRDARRADARDADAAGRALGARGKQHGRQRHVSNATARCEAWGTQQKMAEQGAAAGATGNKPPVGGPQTCAAHEQSRVAGRLRVCVWQGAARGARGFGLGWGSARQSFAAACGVRARVTRPARTQGLYRCPLTAKAAAARPHAAGAPQARDKIEWFAGVHPWAPARARTHARRPRATRGGATLQRTCRRATAIVLCGVGSCFARGE